MAKRGRRGGGPPDVRKAGHTQPGSDCVERTGRTRRSMVNISDMAMLAAGICVGRLIFAPSMRMHLISRLLAAYPCYGVVWFEIDKIGHFATTEIASPDQIILYFTGVGMIWGSATRIW